MKRVLSRLKTKAQDHHEELTPKRRVLIYGAALCLLFCIGYWLYGHGSIQTDNSYVNAHVVQVASRVTGQVAEILVKNNQFVEEGQLLFRLDPNPYNTVVDKAKAELTMREADQKMAELMASKTTDLVKKKAAPTFDGEVAVEKLRAAIAAVQHAKANLIEAELNLQYTHVYAQTTGWIANLSLREGSIAKENEPLFALIGHSDFWVDANFKETEIKNIHQGQKAKVEVDMYPGQPFDAVVESVSRGSGVAFSLLPPQNATGNWVKITQRIPVRLRILALDDKHPLRIGTTATSTIYLHTMHAAN